MAQVEIYTQEWCPYCSRAKALLDRKGAAYNEIPAPHGSPESCRARSRSGGRTSMPQVFIDGRQIGGSDDLAALDQAGKLDPMLVGG